MLRINIQIALLLILASIAGCNLKTSSTASYLSYSSPLAKVVAGIWIGELPCADCESVEYSLELNSEGLFREESVYRGENENLFITEGIWKVKKDSLVILFANDEIHKQFKFIPNSLTMLDRLGNEISSSFAETYRLKREDSGVQVGNSNGNELNNTWVLEEINNNPIDKKDFPNGAPRLEFRIKENKVSGYGGCNQLSGSFSIVEPKIEFDPIISTKMACENLSLENDLLSVLSSGPLTYEISDDKLTLKNKNGKLIFKKTY